MPDLPADPNLQTLLDARRYRRLQILGAAPGESADLKNGTVMRFSTLDDYLDADIARMPSRGEAAEPDVACTPDDHEKHAQQIIAEIDRVLAATIVNPARAFDERSELMRRLRGLLLESQYLAAKREREHIEDRVRRALKEY